MTDKKYKYQLAFVEGQTVQFSELAHMMATALHPEGGLAYGAARINLDDELKLAVRDGLLRVRNPAGLGFHTFPHGKALQRAVFIPNTDLEPFLNARGIELLMTPYGNGPNCWTLENAAAAMQEQLNWHDGTRAEFQDQMKEAAQSGALVVLNPRTCLPYTPETVRTFWEYVTSDKVNAWLATLKAPYRWEVQTAETPAPVVTASVPDGVEADKAGQVWGLKASIQRAPGYRWPLYQVVKAAFDAGQPCPKARDVLNIWGLNPPPDVQVMPDGVKYNNGLGKPKEANLKAIQQAIRGLKIVRRPGAGYAG